MKDERLVIRYSSFAFAQLLGVAGVLCKQSVQGLMPLAERRSSGVQTIVLKVLFASVYRGWKYCLNSCNS